MHRLFRSYGFIYMVAAALAAPVVAAVAWARERIDRALIFAFDLIADKPFMPRLDIGRTISGGGRLAYDGPTMDLRHEAMTSRRSAARHT